MDAEHPQMPLARLRPASPRTAITPKLHQIKYNLLILFKIIVPKRGNRTAYRNNGLARFVGNFWVWIPHGWRKSEVECRFIHAAFRLKTRRMTRHQNRR